MSKEKNQSQITSSEKSPSNNSRLLNFIYNSNHRLFKKDLTEKENNSEKLSLASLKKEILCKLTSYSQDGRSVQFSEGIEEIENDSNDDKIEDDDFFMRLTNRKKYTTPPRKMKTSYKKTKEHIKTPYKTTKSRSSKNKSKNSKEINLWNSKSNVSTKSNYYWKSILDNENEITKYFAQDNEIDINRVCNSVILENPYSNHKEYKYLFNNISLEDNDEEMNKSF